MTATLEGGEWSAERPAAALYLRERFGTHFTGGCVGPRAGLDGRKISSPPEFGPVVSRYTDWATRPTLKRVLILEIVTNNQLPRFPPHKTHFVLKKVTKTTQFLNTEWRIVL